MLKIANMFVFIKLFRIQKFWRPPWWGSSCQVWRNVQSRSTAPGSGSWGWRNILLQCCYWEKTLQRTAGQYAAALLPPQFISARSQTQINTLMHTSQIITVKRKKIPSGSTTCLPAAVGQEREKTRTNVNAAAAAAVAVSPDSE